uniref:BPTI/Kunitz inhibitor domain-containing protein n=1 Tax=Heterorhabditis bacteriophora TaxID=37862 RepID=A0A1I7WFJ7_HETBA
METTNIISNTNIIKDNENKQLEIIYGSPIGTTLKRNSGDGKCPRCGGNSLDSDAFNSKCAVGSWQSWSDCSVTCGHGTRSRNRSFLNPASIESDCNVELDRKDICVEICQESKEEGQCGGTFPRYWYNHDNQRCERFIFTGCKVGSHSDFGIYFLHNIVLKKSVNKYVYPDTNMKNLWVSDLLPNHQLINEFGGNEISDGECSDQASQQRICRMPCSLK